MLQETVAFAVQADHLDGNLTLRLSGELDIAGGPQLDRAMASAAELPLRAVTVDLTGLSFADVRGLSALSNARTAAMAAGAKFSLVSVGPVVRRVIRLAGFSDLEDVATLSSASAGPQPRPWT